jgi:cell division protein FtsX
VREFRQIKCPFGFAAQLAGVVGHGISADAVVVGAACRGIMAAKAPVAGSKANRIETLMMDFCWGLMCNYLVVGILLKDTDGGQVNLELQ